MPNPKGKKAYTLKKNTYRTSLAINIAIYYEAHGIKQTKKMPFSLIFRIYSYYYMIASPFCARVTPAHDQVFDDGYNPREQTGTFGLSKTLGGVGTSGSGGGGGGGAPMREELGCVLYASNVLGSRGPRKMQAGLF